MPTRCARLEADAELAASRAEQADARSSSTRTRRRSRTGSGTWSCTRCAAAISSTRWTPSAGTTRPSCAARPPREGYDVVVAFGGDGTVNEAANGLVGSDTPLTCLPGGRANVYCRILGIPSDVVDATEHLLGLADDWRPRAVDLGRVNGRHFLFSAGVGLDASVVERGRRPSGAQGAGRRVLLRVDRHRHVHPALPDAATQARGSARRGERRRGDRRRAERRAVHVLRRPRRCRSPRAPRSTAASSPAPCSKRTSPLDVPTIAVARAVEPAAGRRPPPDPRVLSRRRMRVRSLDERPLPLQVDGDYIGDHETAEFAVDAAGAHGRRLTCTSQVMLSAADREGRPQRARTMRAMRGFRAMRRVGAARSLVGSGRGARRPCRRSLPGAPNARSSRPTTPGTSASTTLPVAENSARYIAAIGSGTRFTRTSGRSGTARRTGSPTPSSRARQEGAGSASRYASESDASRTRSRATCRSRGGRRHRRPARDHRRPRTCTDYELYDAYPHDRGGAGGRRAPARSSIFAPTGCARPAGPRPMPPGCRSCPGSRAITRLPAGVIDHALRFTAPCTAPSYVYPARHEASTCTGAWLPPMGLRVASQGVGRHLGSSLPGARRRPGAQDLRDDSRRQRLAVVCLGRAEPPLERQTRCTS